MPLPEQRDVRDIEGILNEVLGQRQPPVARCRLLSSGFGTSHALTVIENLRGHKECLGCGNCVDSCPFLSREPSRRDRTAQRTSMALESIVAEDCDLCNACVLACPQVDTTIKHYIVNHRVIDVMPRLADRTGDDDEPDIDLLIEEVLEG